MKLFALALAVCAATAAAHDFESWARTAGKRYTPEEAVARKAIFNMNVRGINEHNAKNLGWTMAVNEFADLTQDEFASRYIGGWRGPTTRNAGYDTSLLRVNQTSLPASVDWTTKGAVTPVKNQGQCGSCWAFSTTGSVEGISFISSGTLPDLSEQQLVDCSGPEGNQGCNGGIMDSAFEYIIKNGGLCSESEYPYTATDGTCKASSCKNVATISGYTNVPTDSESAMMAAVAQQPISIAIEADQMSFQFYSGGVMDAACGDSLDHGVLTVGYGTLEGKDFWKVKNSWGASWGMSGYILLGRGSAFAPKGQCGMLSIPCYPTK